MRFVSKQAGSEEELSEKRKWRSSRSPLRACSRNCSDLWRPGMLSAALLRWHAQEGTQECEQVMAVQEACLSHRASAELYCLALPGHDQLMSLHQQAFASPKTPPSATCVSAPCCPLQKASLELEKRWRARMRARGGRPFGGDALTGQKEGAKGLSWELQRRHCHGKSSVPARTPPGEGRGTAAA